MKNKSIAVSSRLNMEILHAEYTELNHRWQASDVISPFTRIYLITEGDGFLRFDDKEIRLTPGNIYVIPTLTKCSFGCENILKKVYFHISIPLPTGFDLLEELNECFVFSDSETVNKITDCILNPSTKSLVQINSFLYALINECIINMKNLELKEFSPYVTKIMKFIDMNVSAKLTLEKIADALDTSSEKVRKTFRAETGISIGKYIDNLIMHKAEFEVRQNQYSIKEISAMLGFCDQFYFSRCFSQKFGMPPTTYRRQS